VVVGDEDRDTAAHCRLLGPTELEPFLARLLDLVSADE
jgi:hypothetical protein